MCQMQPQKLHYEYNTHSTHNNIILTDSDPCMVHVPSSIPVQCQLK